MSFYNTTKYINTVEGWINSNKLMLTYFNS